MRVFRGYTNFRIFPVWVPDSKKKIVYYPPEYNIICLPGAFKIHLKSVLFHKCCRNLCVGVPRCVHNTFPHFWWMPTLVYEIFNQKPNYWDIWAVFEDTCPPEVRVMLVSDSLPTPSGPFSWICQLQATIDSTEMFCGRYKWCTSRNPGGTDYQLG
jgi:hypothetical protein